MKYLAVLLLLGLLAYAGVEGVPVPEEGKEETTTVAASTTTAAADSATTDTAKGDKPGIGSPPSFLKNIIDKAMNSLPPNIKERIQVIGLNF
uniref:Hypothetical salivary protein 8.2 n=1 Tax=Anopheles darlingi TaxID=43151 RepID=B6DE35_ANODA